MAETNELFGRAGEVGGKKQLAWDDGDGDDGSFLHAAECSSWNGFVASGAKGRRIRHRSRRCFRRKFERE
jgi:hypothetical protein